MTPRLQMQLLQVTSLVTAGVLVLAALGIFKSYAALNVSLAVGILLISLVALSLNHYAHTVIGIVLALVYAFHETLGFPMNLWVVIDIVVAALLLYFAHWATNPYLKGMRFEEYVSTLFPEPDFIIIDRTRDVSKFLNRRVLSDSHPDFVFKNQQTGTTFAVECKWRARWSTGKNGDAGLWWDVPRNERYIAFGKDRSMPVYIALGIGGTPRTPAEVYFLDVEKLNFPFLKQSLVQSGVSRID